MTWHQPYVPSPCPPPPGGDASPLGAFVSSSAEVTTEPRYNFSTGTCKAHKTSILQVIKIYMDIFAFLSLDCGFCSANEMGLGRIHIKTRCNDSPLISLCRPTISIFLHKVRIIRICKRKRIRVMHLGNTWGCDTSHMFRYLFQLSMTRRGQFSHFNYL